MMIKRRKGPWGKYVNIGLAVGESEFAPIACDNYWRHPYSGEEFRCGRKDVHVCVPVWLDVEWHAKIGMQFAHYDQQGRFIVTRKTMEYPSQLETIGTALATMVYSEEEGRFIRRYRRLDSRRPRRNGKSWMAEFTGSYFVLRIENTQICVAAQNMESAKTGIWRALQAMCKQSIACRDAGMRVGAKAEPMVNPSMSSQILLVPSDGEKLRGVDNPMVCMLDEVRAVTKAREWLANAEAAQLSLAEPFIWTGTTANSDPESYEYERFFILLEIQAKPDREPTTLPDLWHKKDGADWKKEKTWFDCNPGLGRVKKVDAMRTLFQKALGIPDEERIFRLEHLNEIVDEIAGAVDIKLWEECAADGGRDAAWQVMMSAERVYVGIDLSWGNDLSSVVLLARDADGLLWIWHQSWMHYSKAYALDKDAQGQVSNWAAEGVLHIVSDMEAPSNETFVEHVGVEIAKILNRLPDQPYVIGLDYNKAPPAVRVLEEHERFNVREVKQGQWLDQAIAFFQGEVGAGQIRHVNDPLFNSAVLNAVIVRRGTHDNRTIEKNASRVQKGARVDPLVAACIACECIIRPEPPKVEMKGVKTLDEIITA